MATCNQQLIRILVVRHGETASNASGIIQGQLDIPLNAKGHLQAYYTAHALAHEHIDEVYTSPLMRARDTALTIVRFHPTLRLTSAAKADQHLLDQGTPNDEGVKQRVATDARLMERNLGELQGQLGAGRAHGDIPGAETAAELKNRLVDFWADMTSHPLEPFAFDAGSQASTPLDSGVNTPTRALDHGQFTLPTPPAAATEVINQRLQQVQPRPTKKDPFVRTVLLVSHGAAMRNLVAATLLQSGAVQLSPELSAASEAGAPVGVKGRFSNCSVTEIHWPVGVDAHAVLSGRVPNTEAHGTLVRWSEVSHLPPELEKQLVDNVDEVEEEEEEEGGSKAAI